MGILKRLSFNWDKLANIVIAKLLEKEVNIIDRNIKSIYYAECAERCRCSNELLSEFKDDSYKKAVLAECESLTKMYDKLVTSEVPIERSDTITILLKITAMAGTLAYCKQFITDDGVDSEFLLLLYKKVVSNLEII
ncbi:hypothetical protein KKA87_10420 [bacterium]|nr:hypothetical protein [bacterium]MBU1874302.1 hypothetical protein [bacterium]